MSRHSGHHRIMVATRALVMMVLDAEFGTNPINLDTHIGIASAWEGLGASGDDLSWWSWLGLL